MPRTIHLGATQWDNITSLDTEVSNLPIAGSATGTNSVAVGEGATAAGDNAVAIGAGAAATGDDCAVIGANASCDGDGGLCIQSTSTGVTTGSPFIIRGTHIGSDATGSMAMGGTTQGIRATAVGVGSSAASLGTACGSNAYAGPSASALGAYASAQTFACAIGTRATAGQGAVAVGTDADASQLFSVVIGYNAQATGGSPSSALGANVSTRVTGETAFPGRSFVVGEVETSDTSPTDIITFPIETDELLWVHCVVTERNTATGDKLAYILEDYFLHDDGGTPGLVVGTNTTANPGSVGVSTVALVVSGTDLIVRATAADANSRTWTPVLTMTCT